MFSNVRVVTPASLLYFRVLLVRIRADAGRGGIESGRRGGRGVENRGVGEACQARPKSEPRCQGKRHGWGTQVWGGRSLFFSRF